MDEVLSVGDLTFRRRCYERIAALTQDGTGILFVSHDLSAVTEICDRVVHLEGGQIRNTGDPARVVRTYSGSQSS